ncbi:MAG: 1-deoxy-D-xylulose-5-phosphate synthase, partial [Oscillospiraceae bacterium]|nr:1-deoxy-D-xylulose-5-phosphate synthase [Oscillospiraceae bacterium]
IPSCGYRKNNPNNVTADSFSETAGKLLCRIAAKDENVCAITAAMKYATGMQHFAARYPERFFDVGIAEQHAVTFAAGLAKGGKLPFFAVYSSFLQRSYDQLIHDASIDRVHMVLGIDRAGFVGEDGETHQGLFDVPMLLTVPGVTVYSPSTYGELEMCMESAFFRADGVAAVRYPKGAETVTFVAEDTDSFSITKNGSRRLAVSYGRIVHNLYAAAETAGCDVLKLARIFPIDGHAAELCMNYDEIYFFEEGSRRGGVGEYLMTELYGNGYRGKFTITAADGFACQASAEECLDECGLSKEKMAEILNGSNIRTEDKIET